MGPDAAVAALAERVAGLEADNARLRRLLESRGAPAELRHRLRATLGLLRAVIRRSAEPREAAADYAAHLQDRLAAIARTYEAIDRRGEVDLHGAVAEELMAYTVPEGGRLRLNGPEVLLRQRPAQVLGLAVHELAVNAVEHGAAMLPGGRIAVAWRLDGAGPGSVLTLAWKETGLAGHGEPPRRGFGTEVLTEMVAHDLGARTALAHEPDGVRWTARIPFPPAAGRPAPEDARDAWPDEGPGEGGPGG